MDLIEEGKVKWGEDSSRMSEDIDKDSISSENEGSDTDCPGGITMRGKFAQEIWSDDDIWTALQLLPGYEDLIDALKDDNMEVILASNFVLTSAVLLAAQLGKSKILEQLLASGGLVQSSDEVGRTPLHLASNIGCLESMKILINHGANVHQKDMSHKITPLHCASSKGNLNAVQLLLKSGADVNASLSKKTALHYAVENEAIDCVKELLEAGAIPNTLQVFSETPLHIAASLGSPEMIKLLLKYGAAVNVQVGHDKSTVLHLAAEDGNAESVRLLIDAGAKVSAQNYKKQTPLHLAALSQATESLEILLKNNADPNINDNDGRTPLHSAIVKVSRSCECVKLLINYGAKVNQPDNFGYTALHLAALNEFSNCVFLLISNGGDVTARTNGGVSVLTFITRRTPDVIPRYISKFDHSIKLTDHEIGDVDCELKLDFRILVPSAGKGETELLLNFIEVGHREILKHPLCETFLFLKWRRIRKYFLFSLFYHALYVLLFTGYTTGVFLRDCESKRRAIVFTYNIATIPPKIDSCNISMWVKIIGYLLISLNMLLMSKELFQIAHNWQAYIKQWENWLQWLIIISVFCCVVPTNDNIRMIMYSWQHHVAAIGIFLTWLELMMIVGRFPIFGLYIQMFTTVAFNFIKFLLAYLCLLIAFGLSFGVLFANYAPFHNIFLGILKTVIMMSGELEFEDIFYGEHEIIYPGTAHVMFLAFVLLVTVILTNLMVGLAVSDIQGLQQSAGLDRLVRQAELVAHLESMLFSKLLTWVSSRLLAFFYKHASLLQSNNHCALYIRPNDPREARIPKDLIKNIYELVVDRKDHSRKKRKSMKENMKVTSGPPAPFMKGNSSYDYVYVGRLEKLNPEFNEFQYLPK